MPCREGGAPDLVKLQQDPLESKAVLAHMLRQAVGHVGTNDQSIEKASAGISLAETEYVL